MIKAIASRALWLIRWAMTVISMIWLSIATVVGIVALSSGMLAAIIVGLIVAGMTLLLFIPAIVLLLATGHQKMITEIIDKHKPAARCQN